MCKIANNAFSQINAKNVTADTQSTLKENVSLLHHRQLLARQIACYAAKLRILLYV